MISDDTDMIYNILHKNDKMIFQYMLCEIKVYHISDIIDVVL
jgi:hypothetical protein